MSADKIRVLHVIKTLSLGGAEVNLVNLVSAMDAEKIETHVAYSMGGQIESRLRQAGVPLFKYAQAGHRIRSLATFPIVMRLARYIRKHRIQIVHTHNFNGHVWGLIAAKLTGAKVVEHVHDFRYLEDEDFKKRRGTDTLYRYTKYFKDTADRVVVLTEQNKDHLLKNGFYPESKIRKIPNGIPMNQPVDDNAQARIAWKETQGLGKESFLILTSARINPTKNIDLVFRVAPEVLARHPEAVFVVLGDGPLLEEFRERAREQKLDNSVRMVGFCEDIFPWLKAADVFFLPSFLELHSIAVLEAMSMKKPVVASREVGSNGEFIKSWESGVLLDPFSDAGWAEALARLIEEPGLRERIGENGYRICRERFDIKLCAKAFEDLYKELAV